MNPVTKMCAKENEKKLSYLTHLFAPIKSLHTLAIYY